MVHHDHRVDEAYLQLSATLLKDIKQRSYTLMRLAPGQQALDVGCGIGIDTAQIARLVGSTGRVVGIDSDRNMVAEAESYAAQQGVGRWTPRTRQRRISSFSERQL